MSYNYADVKCPHCGEVERIRFTVESIPFGSTSIKSEGPNKCFHCKNYFVGNVQTVYSARKLFPHEQRELEKNKQS